MRLTNRRLITLACLFNLTFPAFSNVSVKIDFAGDAWNESEKGIVQQASEAAFSRLITAGVANCVYRESFRPVYLEKKSGKFYRRIHNKDSLRKAWSSQVAFLNKFKRFQIKLHKEKLKTRVLGKAKVGIAEIDRKNYELLNLEITIDPENLANSRKRSPKSGDLDVWINTLAHEIGHNLGYSHTSGTDWENDYPGYVPTELGFCTMTNGKYGSHLGDFRKLKDRIKKFKVR
ncbi:MAG: hypothetical protein HRU09_13875 [Oligoflexales bacterium]|nr:hypothetical protein [Oligoflexales bacterium]